MQGAQGHASGMPERRVFGSARVFDMMGLSGLQGAGGY